MKVSDYIIKFLVQKNIDTAFVMTGAAIATVIDSFSKHKGEIDYICVNHEQAGAMAAESYSRSTGKVGVAIATSGPGATNLITGIAGAWYDCIPALFITGQVRSTELRGDLKILQRGFQELDIVHMVKPITKYATQITDCKNIVTELEKAFEIATSGRPGPVLIDLPMDIQLMEMPFPEREPETKPKKTMYFSDTGADEGSLLRDFSRILASSKKPIIIAGGGIRQSDSVREFRNFIERTRIPVVFSYAGLDTLPFDNPSHIGVLGPYGHAHANNIIKEADLVIALGTRFTKKLTAVLPHQFIPEAKLVAVNIDEDELEDGERKADLSIPMDIKHFLNLNRDLEYNPSENWLQATTSLKGNFLYKSTEVLSPYEFIDYLSNELSDNAVIIPDVGQNVVATVQTIRLKKDQQLFSSWANSPMGYSLPAAMGAKLGNPSKEVICIIGDGGVQVNLQELQTVANNNINIKIFIFNNGGYVTINEFQDKVLDSRYEATDKEHGYSHPDFQKISNAFGINYSQINDKQDLSTIKDILRSNHSVICEVKIDPDFRMDCPKLN